MNYIDEIFERADIQKIREFFLHGGEGNIDPRSYKERTESAQEKLTVRLHEEYPNEQKYGETIGLVYNYVSAIEEVYMEIGLQLGGKIAVQICQNFNAAAGEREYSYA